MCQLINRKLHLAFKMCAKCANTPKRLFKATFVLNDKVLSKLYKL